MKKGVIVSVLILMLAGAGFPFFKGVLLERAVRRSAESVNQDISGPSEGGAIEIRAWDKGYTDSIVEWTFAPPWLEAVYGIPKIIIVDRIHHGIFSIVSVTSLEKNIWFKKWIDRHLDGNNPLKITTTYQLTGDISTRMDLEGFTIKERRHNLEVRPGSMDMAFTKSGNQISTKMTWQGIGIEGKLNLGGIDLTSQATKATDLIWKGNARLSCKEIFIKNRDRRAQIQSLITGYTVAYEKASSQVSIDLTAKMASFLSDQTDVRDAQGTLVLENLDADGVQDLIRLNNSMRSSLISQITGVGEDLDSIGNALEKQMQKQWSKMAGIWEKFLRKGMAIRVSGLYARLPEGDVNADFVLGLNRSMTLTGFLPVMMQPSLITDIISLESDISLPYTLIGYQPALLNPLFEGMQTGLFITQGQSLVHQARIKDNKLFLNNLEVLLE